jgi:hypothetical protein
MEVIYPYFQQEIRESKMRAELHKGARITEVYKKYGSL